jgi:hypothetical protein
MILANKLVIRGSNMLVVIIGGLREKMGLVA